MNEDEIRAAGPESEAEAREVRPLTLKQYANKWGVSYEAVRKQVKRYEEELRDHLSTQNNATFLDAYAQNFLDERRKYNPSSTFMFEPTILDEYKDVIAAQEAKIRELQELVIQLQNDKIAGMRLLVDNEQLQKDKEELEKRLEQSQQEAAEKAEKAHEYRLQAESAEACLEQEQCVSGSLTRELEEAKQDVIKAEAAAAVAKKKADEAEAAAVAAAQKAQEIEGSYKKTIFGLYKRV